MKWLKVFCQVLLIDIALLGAMAPAQAAEVDLQVLVIVKGDYVNKAHPELVEAARVVIEDLLISLGVPYKVFDARTDVLTTTTLYDGARGRFNGIILTDAQVYVNGYGLTFDEFTLLHNYEREFGVHEAVMSGRPSWDASVDLDYGMEAASASATIKSARWVAPAGGTEIFEYVNTLNPLTTVDLDNNGTFAVLPVVRTDGSFTGTVEPLLVTDLDGTTYPLISKITHSDGRQVLLCTLNNGPYYLHSSVLAYEFLNFATSGLFIGARHVYLETHIDDVFNTDQLWNPDTNSNWPDGTPEYRLSAAEVTTLVGSLIEFWGKHSSASDVKLDFAFNGIGTSATDPLTTTVRSLASYFGFINHTYMHSDLDVPTSFSSIYNEIKKNATVWKNLRLPGYQYATSELLTGAYTGLSNGSSDFPGGFNPALGQAASALGVRMIFSNSSLTGQDTIQRIPGYNIAMLPRYPTNLYYNTKDPTELVSEYYSIFSLSRTYSEILQYDADVTVRQMLAYYPYPHMFHQPNLHDYDGKGSSMLIDWLDAVVTKYEQFINIKLPIVSPRAHDLGTLTWQILTAKEASPSGWLETTTGEVTLSASKSATVEVTGLSGGTLYGGQRILKAALSTTAQKFTIDPALTQ